MLLGLLLLLWEVCLCELFAVLVLFLCSCGWGGGVFAIWLQSLRFGNTSLRVDRTRSARLLLSACVTHSNGLARLLKHKFTAHYLLHPSPNTVPSRTGTGIAIITLYVVFLLPVAITYFRLLGTVKDPGFTPQGKPCASTPIKPKQEEQVERHVVRCCTNTKVTERPPSTSTASDVSRPSSAEKPGIGPHGQDVTTLDLEAIFRGDVAPPIGLESFYEKDVFACDQTGLPVWCGTCCNWKPDRTRHCSDVGRCVRKLDHFCPW